MTRAGLILMAGLLFAGIDPGRAALSDDFEKANQLFEKGQFPEAAAAYRKIADSGNAPAAVWFNLGTTYARMQQPGPAIAAFEKARRLAPRDPAIRQNLQWVRRSAQAAAWGDDGFLRQLTLNEWSLGIVILGPLFFALLAAREWRPPIRKALQWPARVIGTCFIIVLVLFFMASYVDRRLQLAVLSAETRLRRGPVIESESAGDLRAGSEVRVRNRKPGWELVELPDGKIGWVQESELIHL